ncbi:hypothetical protein [Novosphingobium huizhouense]|uniref:hypothetical protein n=1 Tax=Novosphingobium huizhouense TaxID=2866625 RepID=UPI001CD81EE2|nr:hypothetical protein [Novosphingobium huizhouense]
MIRIDPFMAEHALELVLQPAQLAELDWHGRQAAAASFAQAGNAFTVRDADGRIIFCGGAVERHARYASLWGLFALDKGAAVHRLLTASRRFIAALPHARVDALVDAGNAGARKWARHIGLELETRLADAAPDGGDMLVYRRTR